MPQKPRGRGKSDEAPKKRHAGPRAEGEKSDEIADLAAAHWGADATSTTYSEEVVERLYSTYLASGKGGRAHAMKLQRLEMSGYLENYLWKHFDAATASWTHVMSAAALVNVKFREAVPAWACFRADPEKFAALFGRVLELPAGKEMDYGERAAHTLFFVHAFASLEDEMVRAQALKLVSLPMWSRLGAKDLAAQLASQPQLARPWKFLQKKWGKEAKLDAPPAASRHERDFIPDLLQGFVAALAEAADDDEAAEDDGAGAARVAYLERSLELFIDLMAQLPTRRFFHAVLADAHLVVLASPALCPFAARGGKRAALFNLLHRLLEYYERFEVDDHRGTPVSEADAKASRSDALQALQRAAFAQDGLREFALSNLSAVDSPAQLRLHFGRLAPAQLGALCEGLGLLHSAADGEAKGKAFLVGMLVHRYQRRDVQQESLARLPLYPDEVTPWDEAVVPPEDFVGDGCLALPKLNLQVTGRHTATATASASTTASTASDSPPLPPSCSSSRSTTT